MERMQIEDATPIETAADVDTGRRSITADDNWMPKSGYGPYCTIPFSSGIGPARTARCGMLSFIGARHEAMLLAEEYAARAIALAARAQKERIDLSREVRGVDGQLLIRPYRVRLCLHLDESRGYLYLCWRGVVIKRGRPTRIRASMWNCKAELDPLIAEAHPAEELMIRQIEAEAADIRRRWFAAVRLIYYMNAAEEYRLADLESGKIQVSGLGGLRFYLARIFRSTFSSRGSKS